MVESQLLEKKKKKYKGENLDIYFHKDLCQHSGNCVNGDPTVFEVGRVPWILPLLEHEDNIQKVINKCPSGALKYRLKGSEEILP